MSEFLPIRYTFMSEFFADCYAFMGEFASGLPLFGANL